MVSRTTIETCTLQPMVAERKRAKSRQRRPTYTEAENEILRETVDRLVDVQGTQGKVGLLLGVTQGFISAFLKKKETAGGSFARAIAEIVDVPLPELLGWADAAEKAESSDPYPNRRKALRAARLVKLSEHAIQTVRAIRIAPGEAEPSPLWWLETTLRKHAEGVGPRLLPPTRDAG